MNIIVTGATGMVGEGVLHDCLHHNDVKNVLIINRRSSGIHHPKLKELLHEDFFDLSSIEGQLNSYDACFLCLGVSSVGLKEPEYYRLTYTLTMHVAKTLSRLNSDMTFCYISGAGTDSTEKGRMMWARVKGRTENDLQRLPFKQVYNFRPAVLKPTKGLKRTLSYYKYFAWLIPIVSMVAPNRICLLKELGVAMIHSVTKGYNKNVLEVKDIKALSKI